MSASPPNSAAGASTLCTHTRRTTHQRAAECLQLAEQHLLSYDLVLQARHMFDLYRARDAPVTTEGTQGSGSATTADSARTAASPVAATQPTRTMDAEASQAELPPAPALPTSSQGHCGSVSVEGGAGRSEAPTAEGMRGGTEEAQGEEEEEEVIGVQGLQAFYFDLGIPTAALEIAETIQRMQGRPPLLDVLRHKEEREAAEALALQQQQLHQLQQSLEASLRSPRAAEKQAPASLGASARTSPNRKGNKRRSMGSARSATPQSARAAARPTPPPPPPPPARGLTFPLFLFLLQQRLCDADDRPACKDAEVAEAFAMLDADGDGVLTAGDVLGMVDHLMSQEGTLSGDRDLRLLAAMHPVELRTALQECDMNADGVVTLDDVLAVLRA